jgi:hypothetical protein
MPKSTKITIIAISLTILASQAGVCAAFSAINLSESNRGSRQPRPALLLVDANSSQNEQTLRFESLLDGLGVQVEKRLISDDHKITPSSYQLIIAVSQTPGTLFSRNAISKLFGSAVLAGTNVLLVGAVLCDLNNRSAETVFGIRLSESSCSSYVKDGEKALVAAGSNISIGLRRELVQRIKPIKAITRGTLSDGSAVFTYLKASPTSGRALAIGISLLDFWKDGSSSKADFYKRPLVLTRLARELLQDGYVGKHASMNGHLSTFLFRWEDVVPVDMKRFSTHEYGRVKELLQMCKHYNIPINIAIISRYVSPTKNINDGWDLVNPANMFLRGAIELAIKNGGSIIAHGFTHQYGNKASDMSALDAEMGDDEGVEFRRSSEQSGIVVNAAESIFHDWGIKPSIWETPHYQGNINTYQEVSLAGFRYINESDTWIFPNKHGIGNVLEGRLLNIPETATNLPDEPEAIRRETLDQKLAIMPDLYEIGAPYLLFFHIGSNHRLLALSRILWETRKYDLWKPSLLEYARFWTKREQAVVKSTARARANSLTMDVLNGFPGLTLIARLPDRTVPDIVTINGLPTETKWARLNGIWLAFPVILSIGDSTIEVRYKRQDVEAASIRD